MINEQLELVSEFQTLFEQPILNKEDEIPIDRRKLRLALLFEELAELSSAYGLDKYFTELCFKQRPDLINTNKLNKKEVLDATCDLQYILCGTILENGQQNEFDPAFADVHASNISKLCTSMNEAINTKVKYASEGISTYEKELGNVYIGVFRESDNKVLKSINYKPVDLNKYV